MRTKSLLVAVFAFFAIAAPASALQVYAPLYNDNLFTGTNVDTSGVGSPIAGSPWDLASPGGPYEIAFSTDGDRAASSFVFNGSVIGLSVSPEGVLSSPQGKIVGADTFSIAASPTTDHMYFGRTEMGSGIGIYSQSGNGALTEIAGSPASLGIVFYDLAFTPDGKLLFGADNSSGLVRAFAVAADGSLTPLTPTPVTTPQAMQVSPDGRFLFVLDDEGPSNRVHAFAIGSDGSLAARGTPVPIGDVSTGKIAVAPDGGYLYVPDSNLDAIVTLRVGPDGSLSAHGAPFVTIDDAEHAVAAPNGDLYVVFTNSAAGIYRITVDPNTRLPIASNKVSDLSTTTPPRPAIRPGRGTNVTLKAKASAKPLTMEFAATASAVRGSVSSLEWLLPVAGLSRDNQLQKSEKLPKPGTYTVRVEGFDDIGCGQKLLYVGQSALCSGSAGGVASVTFDTPAWVTSLSLKPKRLGSKTKLRFKLTEKARVTFTVERPTKGRLVGGSCRKQTRSNAKSKRCTRWERVGKSFRVNGKAPRTNSVKFSGKKLKRGSYRLKAVAVDSGKSSGPAKYLKFRAR